MWGGFRVPGPWQFLPVVLMAHLGVQFVSGNSAKRRPRHPISPSSSMSFTPSYPTDSQQSAHRKRKDAHLLKLVSVRHLGKW